MTGYPLRQEGEAMAYVSKRDLIEKVRPLVDRLRQVAEEVESAVDQLNDLSRDTKRALSEVED
jgi:hypothetical protein